MQHNLRNDCCTQRRVLLGKASDEGSIQEVEEHMHSGGTLTCTKRATM